MTPLLLTVLSFVLLAFEFQNLLSWWRGRVVTPGEEDSRDFTIVVPIYGDPRTFDCRPQLLQYQDNVLVALEVTPPKMQAFADQLEAEGWHVLRILRALSSAAWPPRPSPYRAWSATSSAPAT